MRRRVFNLWTVVSLAAFVFCAVTGIVGFRQSDDFELEWSFGRRSLTFLSDRGALAFVISSGWPTAEWGPGGHRRRWPLTVVSRPLPLTIRSAIFVEATEERVQYTNGRIVSTVSFRAVRSNILWVAVFTLAAPVVWTVRRARRRRPMGVCGKCGYDLRATPGRCPECGTRAAVPPAP